MPTSQQQHTTPPHGDPSAVARRVEAITDILQIVGQYERMPTQPGADNQASLEVLFSQAQPKVEMNGPTQVLVSLRYRCIVATANSDLGELSQQFDNPKPPPGLRFRAEAAFVVSYIISPGPAPSREELDAFARVNVPLNVVPYWREFLDSSLRRAGMPPVMAPVHKTDPAARSVPAAKPTTGRKV